MATMGDIAREDDQHYTIRPEDLNPCSWCGLTCRTIRYRGGRICRQCYARRGSGDPRDHAIDYYKGKGDR